VDIENRNAFLSTEFAAGCVGLLDAPDDELLDDDIASARTCIQI